MQRSEAMASRLTKRLDCWLQSISPGAGKKEEWKVGFETVKGCVEERIRNSHLDWRQQLVG